jgi:exodeoxyribonuclease VII small subunit
MQKQFETAIKQLEDIVNEIEQQELPLEVALSKYQQGVTLIKYCQEKITAAEQQIKILDKETNLLKDFTIE